jgi:hypothetical protein
MSWTQFDTCVLTCMNQQKMSESACEMRKAREEAARVRGACDKLQKQACKICGVGSSCKRLMELSLPYDQTDL